jgi:hypothetical protein
MNHREQLVRVYNLSENIDDKVLFKITFFTTKLSR